MVIDEVRASEGGTLRALVTLKDVYGVEVTSAAIDEIRWQLSDRDGVVINDRTFANGLLLGNDIVMHGDDLIITNDDPIRILAISIIYDSSIGQDLPENTEIAFAIDDLININ